MAEVKNWLNRHTAIISFVIFSLATYWIINTLFIPSAEKILQKTSAEVNKSCPIMVDEITRLDKTATKDKTLTYLYTLINVEENMSDFSDVKKEMNGQLIELVKNNPDLKALRNLGITFIYSYKDKNGVSLFDITITPEQYK